MLNQEAQVYAELLDRQSREIQVEVSISHLIAELDVLPGAAIAAGWIPLSVARPIENAQNKFGPSAAGAFAKLLVLKLIETYPQRVQRIVLPESIKSVYPSTLQRIAEGILSVPHEAYPAEDGNFARDLRLAAQFAVPLTASRFLDRFAFLPRSFFRNMGYAEDFRCLAFVAFRLRGLGPIFRVHIDERDLSDFNEAGWVLSYLRVVEMLRLYPAVKGTAGTSWTNDPQLDRISAKLSYSRRNQVANGAFLRCDGPSEQCTQMALKKSATRRRLYEQGEYIPNAYTIVWPRIDMLRWAANKSAANAAS